MNWDDIEPADAAAELCEALREAAALKRSGQPYPPDLLPRATMIARLLSAATTGALAIDARDVGLYEMARRQTNEVIESLNRRYPRGHA